MDVLDQDRLGDRQQVVVPFQVMRMVRELTAPERCFIQPVPLDHGSHRTVEYDDATMQ
jgi:hypothetical protein